MGNSIMEESFRITPNSYSCNQLEVISSPPDVDEQSLSKKSCSILCSVDFLGSQIIEEPSENVTGCTQRHSKSGKRQEKELELCD